MSFSGLGLSFFSGLGPSLFSGLLFRARPCFLAWACPPFCWLGTHASGGEVVFFALRPDPSFLLGEEGEKGGEGRDSPPKAPESPGSPRARAEIRRPLGHEPSRSSAFFPEARSPKVTEHSFFELLFERYFEHRVAQRHARTASMSAPSRNNICLAEACSSNQFQHLCGSEARSSKQL